MLVFDFLIDLPIKSEWRSVELLRSSILNCLTTLFHHRDFCQSVATVTGELLENAVKYGDWSGAHHGHFGLRVHGKAGEIHIEVNNPVERDSRDAEQLVQMVEWINSFPSPREAFEARVRDVAELSEEATGRLGLALAAYEADARLSVKIAKGRQVSVRAVLGMPLELEKAG